MYILRDSNGQQIVIDGRHARAVTELNWRAYSRDDWRTAEVCNDCMRDGVRTTQMLSRFLMERIVGRELNEDEIVRRKKQKLGTMWDFRDKNLELVARLNAGA